VAAVTAGSALAASTAAALVAAFAVALPVVVFAVVAFSAAASAGIGSAIETSTIGSSSLAILGIRFFIIPTLTTDTIPMVIILTVTDTSLTMNLFTKAALEIPTLWLGKSSSV
jgi:hypothetical protein